MVPLWQFRQSCPVSIQLVYSYGTWKWALIFGNVLMTGDFCGGASGRGDSDPTMI